MLRLFSDIVMRSCSYAPCIGHSYIKISNNTPLTLAKTVQLITSTITNICMVIMTVLWLASGRQHYRFSAHASHEPIPVEAHTLLTYNLKENPKYTTIGYQRSNKPSRLCVCGYFIMAMPKRKIDWIALPLSYTITYNSS